MKRLGPRKYEWLHGKIFLSWKQHALRWHISIGPLDIMWLQRKGRKS